MNGLLWRFGHDKTLLLGIVFLQAKVLVLCSLELWQSFAKMPKWSVCGCEVVWFGWWLLVSKWSNGKVRFLLDLSRINFSLPKWVSFCEWGLPYPFALAKMVLWCCRMLLSFGQRKSKAKSRVPFLLDLSRNEKNKCQSLFFLFLFSGMLLSTSQEMKLEDPAKL